MWVSMCFPRARRAVDSHFIVKKRPYSLAKIATRGGGCFRPPTGAKGKAVAPAATLVSRFQKTTTKASLSFIKTECANAFSDACTRIRARAERAHAILVMSTGPWLPTSWIQSWHRFIVRCISRLRANAFSRRVYTHPSPRRARTCHPGSEHRTVASHVMDFV